MMEVLNLLLTTSQFLQNSSNSSKNLQKSSRMSPKVKFSISLHVSRRSIRSEPCCNHSSEIMSLKLALLGYTTQKIQLYGEIIESLILTCLLHIRLSIYHLHNSTWGLVHLSLELGSLNPCRCFWCPRGAGGQRLRLWTYDEEWASATTKFICTSSCI